MKRWRQFTVAMTADASVLVAVETNVLLDQALADRFVTDALDTIRQRLKSPRIIVPPALHELAFQFRHGRSAEAKQAAETALGNLVAWGYEPFNATPIGHGIVESIGFKLRSQGVLPEQEVNDSFIIAEAALFNRSVLLSSDVHMKNANTEAMRKLLNECDAPGHRLIVAEPREILEKFFLRR